MTATPSVPGSRGTQSAGGRSPDPWSPGSSAPSGLPRTSRGGGPRRRRVPWGPIIGIGLLVLPALAVIVYMFVLAPASQGIAIGSAVVAAIAAVAPFVLVLGALMWIDAWHPKSRAALGFAFLWGAAMAVAIALGFDFAVQLATAESGGADQALQLTVQAPVVEESAKALGVVILLCFGRRYIAGPVDGVVFAGMSAAGFAYTENIQYFTNALAQTDQLGDSRVFWSTFLMRGLMSPFAHVFFTSMTGLGLGLAASRRNGWLYVPLGLGGLALAMAAHGFWNGSSLYFTEEKDFYLWYFAIQLPLFVAWFVLNMCLRRGQRLIVRRRLTDYGRAGWFSPAEVDMLSSQRQRRRAVSRMRDYGVIAAAAMRDFQKRATELAMHRADMESGRRIKPKQIEREHELLEDVTLLRRRMSALARPVVVSYS